MTYWGPVRPVPIYGRQARRARRSDILPPLRFECGSGSALHRRLSVVLCSKFQFSSADIAQLAQALLWVGPSCCAPEGNAVLSVLEVAQVRGAVRGWQAAQRAARRDREGVGDVWPAASPEDDDAPRLSVQTGRAASQGRSETASAALSAAHGQPTPRPAPVPRLGPSRGGRQIYHFKPAAAPSARIRASGRRARTACPAGR